MKSHSPLVIAVMAFLSITVFTAEAFGWQSELYDDAWVSPETSDSPPSFEDDKLIQDFSYAGYHRSEVQLPEVRGPVFDAVDDFSADPSGEEDTTVEIQAAIDAAADEGGGVVYLPAGTYRVRPQGDDSAALRIRDSNVVLRGDGPDETRILNDAWQMRSKDIIRVDSPGSGWATVPDGSPEVSIRQDLLEPTVEIPVDDAGDFDVDDWIVLRADAEEEFADEHNMGDLWGDQSVGPGVMFVRRILDIDEETDTLTIDVPIRYYLKTRDDARVHLAGPHIEEVGLEDFSIGNVEHPEHGATSGWDINDYNQSGTHAYDVHASYALRITRTRNSWIRNVETYRPDENSTEAHVLSNALRVGNSVGVTIADSHFQKALYAGGGGNAYMARITNAQEVLLQDTVVGYNRHGFVFSHMQTSGNVIHRGRAEHTRWRAIGGNAGSSGSDHHMWLSQSNLVDSTQLLEDYFAAYFRGTWGSNHGQTAVHSVFWNLEGLAYESGRDHIVNTQQARYGYAIGTRGDATGISTDGTPSFSDEAHRTDPPDHVEGQGQGEDLEPRSLFAHQLRNRWHGDDPPGRTAAPAIEPQGGTFGGDRYVELSTETPDAEIYYTLDGSTPGDDDYRYDGLIELDEDTNIRTVAVADDTADSRVVPADFRFTDSPCRTIGEQWYSTPKSAQSGSFEFIFEATPQNDEMNNVMGLSDGDAHRYQDLAAIARFSPDGDIDARDAGSYRAVNELTHDASTTYTFRFDVDVQARTYDLFVQPEGENDEIIIAEDFDFRTEQTEAFRLNRFSSFAAEGTTEICNLSNPDDPTPQPPPPGEADAGDDVSTDSPADTGDLTDPGENDAEPDTNTGCHAGTGGTPIHMAALLLIAVLAIFWRPRHQRCS